MNGRQEIGGDSPPNQGGLLDQEDFGLCSNAPVPEAQEAKARLHRVQEQCVPAGPISAVGTWEWDSQTNEVHGSDETLALLGLRREEFAGTRDALAARIHPDDRAHWEHSLGGCIREGKGCRIECRVVLPDESVRWIAILGDAPRDADGQRRNVRGVVLDITERKQAERTLQENERFLDAVFESIQDGISVLSPDLTIRRVNGLMRRWYADALPLEGKKCHLCYQNRDTPCEPCPTLRCLQTGRVESDVVRGVPGSIVEWVELFSYPIKDATSGRVTGVVEFVRDITRRKYTEDALALRERQMRATLDSTPNVAVQWYDQDGRVLYWNSASERIYGWSAAEALGRTLESLILSSEEAAAFRASLARLRESAGPLGPYETTIRRRDGSEGVVLSTVFAIPEVGESAVFVCMDVDISELKRAQEALRRSEEKLRVALLAAEMGTWRWDAHAGRGTRNAELNRILGLEAVESVDSLDDFFSHLHPDDRSAARIEFERAIQARNTYLQELRIVRPDGTVRWLRYQGRPFYDEKGALTYMTGVAVDITARKQAEQERADLEARLHQAQKLEAVGQLAGGVAHDFNNILTAVLGHVELARAALETADAPNEALLESIRAIGYGAEQAARLTRQLLSLSRRQITQPQVLDLNDTVTDMEKMLRRLLSENTLFNVIRPPKLDPVRVDPGQIEQVILNLVVNARDAMPNGGTLTVETRNVLLTEEYAASHPQARSGAHVLLSVSDTGCGMDASVIDRAFDPFFTTKDVNRGTGLGLATVYGIVRQAGGHVTVYSEVGRGSTFRVYLPTVAHGRSPVRVKQHESGAPGGTETIMVCEDDEAVRHLTERLLRGAGYTVLAARDGAHAEGIFTRHAGPIHLLVTDVIMPDTDGRRLADRLTKRQTGLKVLFVSGYTADIIVHHGVLEEGMAFLEKPFSRQSLLRRVRDLLDRDKPEA